MHAESRQPQVRKKRKQKRGVGYVLANHFPFKQSQGLLQQHQGNGWCGADMLLWLAVLV